jgi:hypothetical protein
MTSESRLEKVGLPRSVGCFHSVWAYSREFLALRWMPLKKIPRVNAVRH